MLIVALVMITVLPPTYMLATVVLETTGLYGKGGTTGRWLYNLEFGMNVIVKVHKAIPT